MNGCCKLCEWQWAHCSFCIFCIYQSLRYNIIHIFFFLIHLFKHIKFFKRNTMWCFSVLLTPRADVWCNTVSTTSASQRLEAVCTGQVWENRTGNQFTDSSCCAAFTVHSWTNYDGFYWFVVSDQLEYCWRERAIHRKTDKNTLLFFLLTLLLEF